MRAEQIRTRRGVRWPMGVDERGRIEIAGGADVIARSVWVVLSTKPGERLMRPNFGCGVWEVLARPPSTDRTQAARAAVEEALDRWVVGADIDEVEVSLSEPASDDSAAAWTAVEIAVRLVDRATQQRHRLVYRRRPDDQGMPVVELDRRGEAAGDESSRTMTRGRGDVR